MFFTPVADIWRFAFIATVIGERCKVFAMPCAPRAATANRTAFAMAIKTNVFAPAFHNIHARMLGSVCALFFVAARFDLLGYRSRILADDFPYMRESTAL